MDVTVTGEKAEDKKEDKAPKKMMEPQGQHYFCAFAGRRDGKPFQMSHEELAAKYAGNMRMMERIPDALSGAMGNQMYVAVFPTEEEMNAFYADAVRCW